jgi:hypothetical protein
MLYKREGPSKRIVRETRYSGSSETNSAPLYAMPMKGKERREIECCAKMLLVTRKRRLVMQCAVLGDNDELLTK